MKGTLFHLGEKAGAFSRQRLNPIGADIAKQLKATCPKEKPNRVITDADMALYTPYRCSKCNITRGKTTLRGLIPNPSDKNNLGLKPESALLREREKRIEGLEVYWTSTKKVVIHAASFRGFSGGEGCQVGSVKSPP